MHRTITSHSTHNHVFGVYRALSFKMQPRSFKIQQKMSGPPYESHRYWLKVTQKKLTKCVLI